MTKGGIGEGPEPIEERDQEHRSEEAEDRGHQEAEEPSREPPPRGRYGKEPEEDAPYDDRTAEAETNRLEEVLRPSPKGLRGKPGGDLPPMTAHVGEGKVDRA